MHREKPSASYSWEASKEMGYWGSGTGSGEGELPEGSGLSPGRGGVTAKPRAEGLSGQNSMGKGLEARGDWGIPSWAASS